MFKLKNWSKYWREKADGLRKMADEWEEEKRIDTGISLARGLSDNFVGAADAIDSCFVEETKNERHARD